MIRTLLHIRILSLKNFFRTMGREKSHRSGKRTAIGLGLLFLLVFAEFGFLFYTFFAQLAGGLSAAGVGWFYFTLYALLDIALMLVGGVFTAKATLFEAKDNELLFSMPIPPRYILLSRMVSLWLLDLVFHLILTVPVAIAWLTHATVTVRGVIGFVALSFFLPAFSLAISALFGWLLALISARVRRKSLITTALSLLFLAAYFVLVARSEQIIMYILEQGTALSDKFRSVAVLYWLGNVCAEGDLLQLLWVTLLLLIPFAVAYYLLSVTLIRNVTTKRGFAKIVYREKQTKALNGDRALLGKEMRRFFSSPAYIMNAGLGSIFLVAGGVFLAIKGEMLRTLASQIPFLQATLPFFAAVGLCMASGMCLFTASSVSIEGKTLWIVRSMPVATPAILQAKLLTHLVLSLPAMLIACIGAVVAIRPDPLTGVLLVLTPLLYTWFTALLGLAENLRHPNLNWISETQAVKSGLAVLFTMLITMGVEAVFAVGGAIFTLKTALDPRILLVALSLALAVACQMLYRWLMRDGVRRFDAL